jgi:glycosyltransferase involved in cell wall biosynthesis
MQLPTISVVTPSLNSGAYLEDAILSVAQQQGVLAEHLVQDSLSRDNTLEILRRYPHVRWQWESDSGQSDAINRGFLRATGDLVGWLNADDYYLPGGLQAIAQAAAAHPEADVFHGDCVFVDGRGSITRSKVEHEFDRDILFYFGCYIPSTATFFRRRVIEQGYLLDCDFRVCMDFEYFVRLATAGLRFHYVPQFIAAFRWHDNNISLQQAERRAYERHEVQRRFGAPASSQMRMELLRQGFRAKRVMRKIASGNAWRELKIRRQKGEPTLWMRDAEVQDKCASLACL